MGLASGSFPERTSHKGKGADLLRQKIVVIKTEQAFFVK
jgi:hypothetical protein